MSVESLQIIIDAIDNATAPIRAVQEAMNALEGQQQGFMRTLAAGERLTNFGQAYTNNVSRPIAEGLLASGEAAIEFESAMSDVSRAFNAPMGSDRFNEAEDSIQALSLELGQMPGDVAAIATESGRLGVAFDQFEDYTRLVTAAGVAFDMTAQDAGSSIGVLTNVLGYMDEAGRVNIQGLSDLGDAINYFADTGATSESAIVNVLQRAGGATRAIGLLNEESVALSAAFLNLGYAPEVVGTAMNGMLPQLFNATRGTSEFQDALSDIGLPAAQFEQMMRDDAAGALQEFITRVGESENASAILTDMFGTGSDASMLLSAAQNAEAFVGTMQSLEGIDPGSMMETFAQRTQTSAAAMERFRSGVANLAINVGSVLLPALNGVLDFIQPIVVAIAEFAGANPQITQMAVGFALVVAAVGPLLVGIGMVVSAIGTLQAAFAAGGVLAGFGGALTAIGSAIASIVATVAGLAAIPLAIFAIGEAAQGTTLSLATVGQVLQSTFAQLTANLAQVGPAIMGVLSAIGMQFQVAFMNMRLAAQTAMIAVQATIAAIGASITTTIASFVASIRAGASQALAAIQSMGASIVGAVNAIAGQMVAAGANIVRSIAQGIMSGIGAVTSAISSVASTIRGALPFSPPEWGPLSDIMSSGGNIVNAIASGMTPAPIASAMSSALSPVASAGAGIPTSGAGGGGSITVSIGDIYANTAEDAGAIASTLDERLRATFRDLLGQEERRQARVSYG